MDDDSMKRDAEAAWMRRGGAILCCGHCGTGEDLAKSGKIEHTRLCGINFRGGLFVPLFSRGIIHSNHTSLPPPSPPHIQYCSQLLDSGLFVRLKTCRTPVPVMVMEDGRLRGGERRSEVYKVPFSIYVLIY